jgi:hypothetical protein
VKLALGHLGTEFAPLLQLGISGSGPENSMSMIHLDLSEIKDISSKITIEELRALLYPFPVEEVDE